MPIENKHIRNFCIVAHIDHGKSTLADRLLEYTGTVAIREMQAQLLDDMALERSRGITIKARAVAMKYQRGDQEYEFNLIDTPGHVDFHYEVSRSLACCEGAILVVDAAQGVEAQTLANAFAAMNSGLHIVPFINKIDLQNGRTDEVLLEMEHSLAIDSSEVLKGSAKAGLGIKELLDAVIDRVPPPRTSDGAPPDPFPKISHADCEKVSKQLSVILDVEELINGPGYVLEVSSPGLDRALTKPADFERFSGHLAKVWTNQPVEELSFMEGRITGVEAGNVRLELQGKTPRAIEVPFAAIRKANLVVEF